VDLFGTNIRILTNEKIEKDFGELLDINFPKEEVFLFNYDDGRRITLA
jgi:hypothetical protein